jgi:hypothetical protein
MFSVEDCAIFREIRGYFNTRQNEYPNDIQSKIALEYLDYIPRTSNLEEIIQKMETVEQILRLNLKTDELCERFRQCITDFSRRNGVVVDKFGFRFIRKSFDFDINKHSK